MMPFSLNGAAAPFQRVMDQTLKQVQDCAVAYIDDILTYSPSWVTHITHLHRVLQALRQTRLMVNLKKSKIGQDSVQYLSFHIGKGKIWAGSDKVAALRELQLCGTRKELQQFLGLANYYCRFIPCFSSRALTDLPSSQRLPWSPEATAAFNDIQTALCTNVVLYAPLPHRPFQLYTDASNMCLGAVLTKMGPLGNNQSCI